MINIPPVPYSPDTRKRYKQAHQFVRFSECQTNNSKLLHDAIGYSTNRSDINALLSHLDNINHIDIHEHKTIFWRFFIEYYPDPEERRIRYKKNRRFLYRQTSNFPRKRNKQ